MLKYQTVLCRVFYLKSICHYLFVRDYAIIQPAFNFRTVFEIRNPILLLHKIHCSCSYIFWRIVPFCLLIKLRFLRAILSIALWHAQVASQDGATSAGRHGASIMELSTDHNRAYWHNDFLFYGRKLWSTCYIDERAICHDNRSGDF